MLRNRQYILALGDFGMCIFALALMVILRLGTHYNHSIVLAHARAFSLVFLVWFIVFFIFNLYDIKMANPNPRTIGRLGLAMFVAIILGGFVFYIHTAFGIAPRANLLIVGVLSFIGITVWRRLFYRLFASTFSRAILIIGSHKETSALATEIKNNKHMGQIVKECRTVEEALTYKQNKNQKIDVVIVEPEDPGSIALVARTFDASILTLVGAHEELFGKIPLSLMNDELAREIATKHPSYGYMFVTRIIEIAISIFVLILTSPLLLIASIAKKLEDGDPVILFPHNRVGKNGKIFHCYKIRSMIIDAEKSGVQWTAEHDPRITRVGRIIRKLHIDELPQFWNILRGDMALVGPRPERPEFVEKLEKEIPYYFLRAQIAPGFTGWAQIKFRYARTVLDSKEKLEYDLYYAKNRTILLDIGIILKTIQIIFTH